MNHAAWVSKPTWYGHVNFERTDGEITMVQNIEDMERENDTCEITSCYGLIVDDDNGFRVPWCLI